MCATLLCTCETETVCPSTQSVENANLTVLDGWQEAWSSLQKLAPHQGFSYIFFYSMPSVTYLFQTKAQSASRVLQNSVHTGYSLLYEVLGEKLNYNEVTTAIHLVTGAAVAHYSLDCCWLCRMVGIN